MTSISETHTATPSMDEEIESLPVSQSFISRVMTRFRVWRSRFKRKDRQQVACPQTSENRVSDAVEAIELDLDEYLATPTALTSPSLSFRSSIRSGVFDIDSVVDRGGDTGTVTHAKTSGLESFTACNVFGLEGLPPLTMVDADGVPPASFSPDFGAPHIQLEDTPSTNSHLTLSPSPIPLTPLDREVPLVHPFEALRAYANRDRSPLADISGSAERHPVLDTETTRPATHPTTASSIDEWDIALRALATGSLAFDFLQKLPSSNSARPSCDVGSSATSSSAVVNDGRDTDRLRFAPSWANAKRLSSSNEQNRRHAREFHIQLAATSLGRERRTVRVPTNVDLGYIRFREELKQTLTGKGDECIWRGLEMQDDPRL